MRLASSPTLELALLGFLRRQPRHGYAIHGLLSDPAGLGPVWRLKRSQLYALLNKLEDAGYVTTSLEPQESRPPRKLFHLTSSGEAAFLDWVQSPVQHGRSLRLEFLVRLYFARREGPEVVARLLAAQREQCQAWLAEEQAILHEEEQSGHTYGQLVHQYRLGQIEAMLAWLDHCEENIRDS
ncbi:MAG TPA: PadR family transcriptional regulator [Candidatus Sulfomarinibacteraceae bacterium]|nr:PadR family transcriptional regulator [Candidatus Sulfomarinibacteraceae bacterium]